MSPNGNHIYIVCKADEVDLQRVAENELYTMQLALGVTDLSSLEPCDRRLIPLRKIRPNNDYKLKELKTLRKELDEYFEIVDGRFEEDADKYSGVEKQNKKNKKTEDKDNPESKSLKDNESQDGEETAADIEKGLQ